MNSAKSVKCVSARILTRPDIPREMRRHHRHNTQRVSIPLAYPIPKGIQRVCIPLRKRKRIRTEGVQGETPPRPPPPPKAHADSVFPHGQNGSPRKTRQNAPSLRRSVPPCSRIIRHPAGATDALWTRLLTALDSQHAENNFTRKLCSAILLRVCGSPCLSLRSLFGCGLA